MGNVTPDLLRSASRGAGSFEGEARRVLPAPLRPAVAPAPAGTPEFAEWLAGFFIGEHPVIHQVRAMIEQCALSEEIVLVEGETGVGKDLAARAIHEGSSRRGRKFVEASLATLKDTATSELFGHRRGAFTGAVSDRAGILKEADGGTLLLSDINHAPFHVQPAILRAIEEKRFRPLGGHGESLRRQPTVAVRGFSQ